MKNDIIVDKNKLNRYKLKITALSPVHIGTGEVYEPTNYVIDENKLFAFDEVLFYKSLSVDDKSLFNNKLINYMSIIDFYKSKKEEAKKISHFECEASNEVQTQYDKKRNKDNQKTQNQLEIQTTFKNPNTHRAIIPGSSIKGMLDTALRIYPNKIKDNALRQNLIISDAILLKGGVEIGNGNRKNRKEEKEARDIPIIVEAIRQNSTFIFSIDSKMDFDTFKKSMKDYHQKRKNSKYKESDNSFIARVGKYCGMEYMVDVDNVDSLRNSYKNPLATYNLYSNDDFKDEQFGWIKIELISDDEYKKALQEISEQEQKYYDDIYNKQKDIKQNLLKESKLAKERLEKERLEKIQEEERLKEQEEQEKIRLESLSPLDLKIENLQRNNNDPFETMLLKAIQEGQFDDNKKEALEKLKNYMIENEIWKENSTSKKPQKDKAYQKTLKVMELLNNL